MSIEVKIDITDLQSGSCLAKAITSGGTAALASELPKALRVAKGESGLEHALKVKLNSPLVFKPTQVAIGVVNLRALRDIKALINLIVPSSEPWTEDEATAKGFVRTAEGHIYKDVLNVGSLHYKYDMIPGIELELLCYTSGANFLQGRFKDSTAVLSHLGMHVTKDEMKQWRDWAIASKINIAQEVQTLKHTNPKIKDIRRYKYMILDTYKLLGFDLKFIERIVLE